ncbi:MAG: hypothetical protein MJ252_28140 [archaeon]|nr:hypothetical protein [archaeon]
MFKYKNEHTLEERQAECQRIKNLYKDRLPVICEKAPTSRLREAKKTKYLVPEDMPVVQFHFLIRKGISLSEECALFFLIDGKHNLTGTQSMKEVYDTYKDKDDGFLYIFYADQLIWGH